VDRRGVSRFCREKNSFSQTSWRSASHKGVLRSGGTHSKQDFAERTKPSKLCISSKYSFDSREEACGFRIAISGPAF